MNHHYSNIFSLSDRREPKSEGDFHVFHFDGSCWFCSWQNPTLSLKLLTDLPVRDRELKQHLGSKYTQTQIKIAGPECALCSSTFPVPGWSSIGVKAQPFKGSFASLEAFLAQMDCKLCYIAFNLFVYLFALFKGIIGNFKSNAVFHRSGPVSTFSSSVGG